MPMKMPYKLFAACCLFFGAFNVTAQPYPNHVVRIILPYPPGGSMDALGRMVFDRVSQALGQQFVIDYRPGASGNIGSEIAARSAPDGHTLLLNTLPFVVNPSLYKKMPFDTIKDFAPISLLATSPFVMVCIPRCRRKRWPSSSHWRRSSRASSIIPRPVSALICMSPPSCSRT